MAAGHIGSMTEPQWKSLTPPVAARRPVITRHHGDSRTDDYAWLRDPGYPDVRKAAILEYLNAENAYREAVMAPLAELQETLFRELKGRLKDDDCGVPIKNGPWFYSWRFEPGAQYRTHFRIPFEEGPNGATHTILDEPALAADVDYLRVRAVEPSPDHSLLAYSADTDGSERFAIRIRNLETGEDLPDRIPNTSGEPAWATDNRTLFYVRLDEQLRPSSVWRHRLGTSVDEDVEVYRESDPGFGVSVHLGRDMRFLFIHAGDQETSEVRLVPADDPSALPRLVSARQAGRLYRAEHRDGTFWILTDDTHPNQRLATAPVERPDADNWQEVIAASDSVFLTGLDVFKDWMLIEERESGVKHMRVRHFAGGAEHRIAFPEPAYAVHPAGNVEFEQPHLRIAYQSLVTPPTVWDYDIETRERAVRKIQEIPSGYDASLYVSEREMAPSHDSAEVPVTIVRRKDTPKDGSAPLYLYAYGSYGMNMDPWFSTARLSLLDRGFVFALANPRGGSELGKSWYEAGQAGAQGEHVPRRDRRGPASRGERLCARRQHGGGRRQRRRIDGRRNRQYGAGGVQSRGGACAVCRCPEHDAGRYALVDAGRISGMGQPVEKPGGLSADQGLQPVRQCRAERVSAPLRYRWVERPAGYLLGARQMGRKAACDEDRRQSADAAHEYGRRPWRQVRPLRGAPRGGGGIRLHADGVRVSPWRRSRPPEGVPG